MSSNVIKQILGESSVEKMVVARLDDPIFSSYPSANEISEIEDDDPLLVRLDVIPDAVDAALKADAENLVADLKRQGFTHIYTG